MADTQIKRYRPHVYQDPSLDLDLKTAYDQIYTLEDQSVQGVVNNQALASGSAEVLGSQNGIETGLATVTRVVAVIQGSSAVNEWVTALPTPNVKGAVSLYVWKPTAAADNTPIASTTTRTIAWFAIGQRT